jgi:hypothetical protein
MIRVGLNQTGVSEVREGSAWWVTHLRQWRIYKAPVANDAIARRTIVRTRPKIVAETGDRVPPPRHSCFVEPYLGSRL